MPQSTAAAVRRRVLQSNDRFWRVEDFSGPPNAVGLELRRLAAAGELERVRRGVYWRGRRSRFGMAAPAALSALREVVGPGQAVGASGWYATNLLGLSTQVSPVPVVSITTRSPQGLRGIKVINRSGRIGRREARLNELEVTILEALEGWDRYVELSPSSARDRFVELLRGHDVRVDRLVRAARTESTRVRERLRAVLRYGGWHAEAMRVRAARAGSARDRGLKILHEVGV